MDKAVAERALIEKRLQTFFKETVDAKDFAKYMRRVNYILALSVIRMDEQQNTINNEWADDGFYWLNELAEVLDPVLEF